MHLTASDQFLHLLCVPADNPAQIASVSVAVKILDVNDNPPSLTHYLEAYVCENAIAGQVRRHQTSDVTMFKHHSMKNHEWRKETEVYLLQYIVI